MVELLILPNRIMQNKTRRIIIIVLSIAIFAFLIWGLLISNLGQSDGQRAKSALWKGVALGRQGKYNEAINYLNKSIKLNPNESLTYYVRGNEYYEKKEYDSAISDFSEALKISPTYTNALIMRGLSYVATKNYDEAERDFSQTIKIHDSAEAYNHRGLLYNEKGEYDKAIADFTKSIEINPQFAFPYQWRAVSYYYKKEYDKAWEDLNKAEKLAKYKPNEEFIAELKKESGRDK